jgi:hypothetical protein
MDQFSPCATVAVRPLNNYSPPDFQEETDLAVLFGECSPRMSVTGPLAITCLLLRDAEIVKRASVCGEQT